MDYLFQKFRQILVKVVKTPHASNSLQKILKWWTAKTFSIFNLQNPFSIYFLIIFFQFLAKSLQGESIPLQFLIFK